MDKELNFGERLRAAMEMRDWTQGKLAGRSGVPQGHISMILANKRVPRIDKATALARALGISLDWLVGLPKREKETLEPDEEILLHAWRNIPDKRIKSFILRSAKDAAKEYEE